MLSWFRADPIKKLRRKYEAKMKEARDAEKFGDRALQAELYSQAEEIYKEIEALEAASG